MNKIKNKIDDINLIDCIVRYVEMDSRFKAENLLENDGSKWISPIFAVTVDNVSISLVFQLRPNSIPRKVKIESVKSFEFFMHNNFCR
jgi:hypothetical protein